MGFQENQKTARDDESGVQDEDESPQREIQREMPKSARQSEVDKDGERSIVRREGGRGHGAGGRGQLRTIIRGQGAGGRGQLRTTIKPGRLTAPSGLTWS